MMRFGLVGAGPWAGMTHAPGLAAVDEVEFVGVWARRLDQAQALAERFGGRGYDDYRAFLADVEAVSFTVPPEVQAEMAIEAARAGKHLLLEKPVAASAGKARELADAAQGVASVVFFTDRFTDSARGWFTEAQETGGWQGGWVRWLGALQQPGNPFGAPAWRHEKGALWDVGPHALSSLTAALGPVERITAAGGAKDLVELIVHHEAGPTSSVTLSVFAPPAAVVYDVTLWGDDGFSTMPQRPGDLAPPLAVAARELIAAAEKGSQHPVDVRFGARITELLADAQAQVENSSRG